MHEESSEFIGKSLDRLDGSYPGLPKTLEKLRQEQLGRAITTFKKNEVTGEVSYDLHGYILPLNKNELSHLLVFRDGTMLMVEAHGGHESTLEHYRKSFAASEEPYKFSDGHTLDTIIDHLSSYSWARNMHNSRIPADEKYFETAIEQAISCAQESKKEREAVTQRLMDRLMDRLNAEIFNPTRPQDPSQEG
ncbi:MAG: hypothetical protein ABIO02_02700 [Patescibacteria group bacterium]